MEKAPVFEGWINKRGEYVKNWRPRYFYLYEDGNFCGFKEKPPSVLRAEPLNQFSIKRCQVISIDKPKKYSFIIRCLQMTTLIERVFNCETSEMRDEWVKCIKSVSDKLAQQDKVSRSCTRKIPPQITEKSEKNIDSYEMLKVLGHGTFGKVVLARDKETGIHYAIKILRKDVILEKDETQHTIAEGRVLKNTRHPFLTSMAHFFQTKERLFFVMEYANGGELFFHLSREKVFTEERSRLYGAEITLAVSFLHQSKIVYRDLKLENLLLDHQGHIKIADFGLCKEDIGAGDKTKTFCGTPEYLAPEVIEDSEYGKAVDWWGLGIVMYEMLCGRLPFFNKDHEILFELILTKEVNFTHSVSNVAKNFISLLLKKKPKQRLGGGDRDGEEVKEHQFFNTLDWDDVLHKRIKPSFIPQVANSSDTKYFDEEFTSEPLKFTPPTKDVAFDFEL